MNITVKDLQDAKQLLKDYNVCGNWNGDKSGYGCNQVFRIKDLKETVVFEMLRTR